MAVLETDGSISVIPMEHAAQAEDVLRDVADAQMTTRTPDDRPARAAIRRGRSS